MTVSMLTPGIQSAITMSVKSLNNQFKILFSKAGTNVFDEIFIEVVKELLKDPILRLLSDKSKFNTSKVKHITKMIYVDMACTGALNNHLKTLRDIRRLYPGTFDEFIKNTDDKHQRLRKQLEKS